MPFISSSASASTASAANPEQRLALLREWLATLATPSLRIATLRPASADASFRRYFRVDAALDAGAGSSSYIVMDAPPPHEDVRPFVHVAEVFGNCGVSVPQVFAQDVERGFLLLSDLGSTTFLQQISPETAPQMYMDAIAALILLQTHSQPYVLPEYSRSLLMRELMLFPDWYIEKHVKATLSAKQTVELNKVFEVLLANNLAQAQVYVHRDYHSRNLMVLPDGKPGILDFQDAVYGPITYDLASLLRDAYVQWDEELVLDWVVRYWEQAKRAGLPVKSDIDGFYRDFEYMGLQRHLKILGIFARLNYRDGKDAYLRDLPLVLDYVRKTANRYAEFRPLLRLLDALEDKVPQVGYTF